MTIIQQHNSRARTNSDTRDSDHLFSINSFDFFPFLFLFYVSILSFFFKYFFQKIKEKLHQVGNMKTNSLFPSSPAVNFSNR